MRDIVKKNCDRVSARLKEIERRTYWRRERKKERKRKKDTDRKSEWVGEKSEQKGGQTEGEKDRKRKKERNREKREGENEVYKGRETKEKKTEREKRKEREREKRRGRERMKAKTEILWATDEKGAHRIAGRDETKFSFVENSVSKTTKHQNIKKEKNSFNLCVKKNIIEKWSDF